MHTSVIKAYNSYLMIDAEYEQNQAYHRLPVAIFELNYSVNSRENFIQSKEKE
jgi:hypothetical protein